MARKIPMGTIVEMQVREFGAEPYTLKTHLQDTLRFEKKFGHSPTPNIESEANMDMMRLAYFAARRLELTDKPNPDVWMANVDECDVIPPTDDDGEADGEGDELDEFGPYVSAGNPTE